MELEVINKLYLELSQVATARTKMETLLANSVEEGMARAASAIGVLERRITDLEHVITGLRTENQALVQYKEEHAMSKNQAEVAAMRAELELLRFEMKDQDVCPVCGAPSCVPEVAIANCENYGNTYHTVECRHCRCLVDVIMSREPTVIGVEKSEKTESDY